MITDARAQLDALPEKWRKQADAISATMEVGCFGEATVNRKCADDLAAVLASLPAPPDEETPTNTDEEEVHLFVPRSGPDDIWCRDCEFHRESSWHRHTPLTAPPPGAVRAAERPEVDGEISSATFAAVAPPRDQPQAKDDRFERIKAQLYEEWRLQAQGIHHDHLSDLSWLIVEVEYLRDQLAASRSSAPAAPPSGAVRDDLDWTTCGIIEIAVRNPNVSSYMNHWEIRALKAEAELATRSPVLDPPPQETKK